MEKTLEGNNGESKGRERIEEGTGENILCESKSIQRRHIRRKKIDDQILSGLKATKMLEITQNDFKKEENLKSSGSRSMVGLTPNQYETIREREEEQESHLRNSNSGSDPCSERLSRKEEAEFGGEVVLNATHRDDVDFHEHYVAPTLDDSEYGKSEI